METIDNTKYCICSTEILNIVGGNENHLNHSEKVFSRICIKKSWINVVLELLISIYIYILEK